MEGEPVKEEMRSGVSGGVILEDGKRDVVSE